MAAELRRQKVVTGVAVWREEAHELRTNKKKNGDHRDECADSDDEPLASYLGVRRSVGLVLEDRALIDRGELARVVRMVLEQGGAPTIVREEVARENGRTIPYSRRWSYLRLRRRDVAALVDAVVAVVGPRLALRRHYKGHKTQTQLPVRHTARGHTGNCECGVGAARGWNALGKVCNLV